MRGDSIGTRVVPPKHRTSAKLDKWERDISREASLAITSIIAFDRDQSHHTGRILFSNHEFPSSSIRCTYISRPSSPRTPSKKKKLTQHRANRQVHRLKNLGHHEE